MFKKYLEPYFKPADVEGEVSGSILEELSKDEPVEETPSTEEDEEIIPDHDLDLTEAEEEEAEEDDQEDEEDSKEKDEEDKELDLEDKEEDELELAKIPKRQEIKAAFPDIFKKFPQLEHALYREQAYTEVFPTVHDAKDAKEAIEQFNGFQSELLNGNIDNVLKSVKATDPKAFAKIANGILDSLVRVDPNSHLGITRQVSKGILNYMHTAAGLALKKNPDDKDAQQTQIAAEIIHDKLFNSREVTPDNQVNVEEREDPEKTKFNKERAQFEETRFTAAFNTVSTKMNSLLTNAVTRDIDTKDILPPYVKKTVIKDVMSELDRQLISDKPFKSIIDKLWLKARDANYSSESLERLERALKNKAKTVLPAIMKAKKGEAMKGLSSQPKKSEAKRELSRTTGNKTSQKAENLTLNRKESDRLTRRPGESKLDFLMRD